MKRNIGEIIKILPLEEIKAKTRYSEISDLYLYNSCKTGFNRKMAVDKVCIIDIIIDIVGLSSDYAIYGPKYITEIEGRRFSFREWMLYPPHKKSMEIE